MHTCSQGSVTLGIYLKPDMRILCIGINGCEHSESKYEDSPSQYHMIHMTTVPALLELGRFHYTYLKVAEAKAGL